VTDPCRSPYQFSSDTGGSRPARNPVISIAVRLDQVMARRRAQRQATTEALLHLALTTRTGAVRGVSLDASGGSVLLLIDDLGLRVAVSRTAQAQELLKLHRAAPTQLTSGVLLDGGRVLLTFSDGEHLVPLVGEALTRPTTLG